MEQTRDAIAQHVAERWCWQAAGRDDSRVARRLSRRPVVEGVSRLDEGAVRDDCCHCWPALGVRDLRAAVHGTAVQRVRGPCVPSGLRDGLTPWCGMERRHVLPAWLCREEARRRQVGCHAQPVRQGVGPRGAATRQGPRTREPLCPDTVAEPLGPLHLRDLEALCTGALRALAQASVLGAQVPGRVEATELETTARDEGCGHGTRQRKSQEKRGQMPASAVTVAGGQGSVVSDARPQMPLAVTVVPIHAHAVRAWRAWVTPARAHLAGQVRRHTLVCDQGVVAGTALGWLDQPGRLVVVPAQDDRAVTADARAQAAAGEAIPLGCRDTVPPSGRVSSYAPKEPGNPARNAHKSAWPRTGVHSCVAGTAATQPTNDGSTRWRRWLRRCHGVPDALHGSGQC